MNYTELKRLAESGDSDYQLMLARLYGMGKIEEIESEVEPDLKESFDWCKKSAELGNIKAQANLGNMYNQAIGTEHDPINGRFWLEKAASQGHERSKVLLATIYMRGVNVDVDIDKALEFLYSGANSGDPEAQMFLGSSYMEGKDIPQDWDEAIFWLTKAAESYEPDGQYNLGLLYLTHPNTRVRNYYKGYKWLYSSIVNEAKNAHHAQQMLDKLADYITKDEIDSAKNEAMCR